MNQRILVTGYGGFLGSAICKDLIQHGYQVRGIARNHYEELALAGVECVRADVTDLDACNRASSDVAAIIHTAALAGVWGHAGKYEAANVQSTSNLLSAARSNGVSAFVLTSSPSVTFNAQPQENIDESAPYPDKWLCHYPRTKAIAEKMVLQANSQTSLATCALRPHLIWGVGDPHLIPRVIERCRSGRLRRVGAGTNLIDTVHVDNASISHRLALEKMLARDAEAMGKAYFITDGQPIECWQWISFLVEAAGLKAPNRSISYANAYRVGAMLEWLYKLTGKQEEPPMTRFVASQLGLAHYFNIESAKQRLGYQPLSNREERLEELKAWIAKTFQK